VKAGWVTRPLAELCRIEIGGTPPRGQSKFWDEKKTTNNVWLSIADLPKELHARISSSAEHLSDEGAKRVKVVKAGTLLVSFKLTLGRLAFADIDLRTNEAIAALELIDEKTLNREYLYWYLTFFDWQKAAEGEDKIKGKTLNKAKLAVILVVVPPLSEQQRIVDILNEAFAGLATATANAEKNLKNARELFESYLDSVFAQGGQGWVERRLGDLFDIGSSKRIRETDWTSFGVPFYGGKEIVRLARYGSVVSNAYISEDKYQDYASKYDMPRKGDILITARGTIGVGYVVREGDKFYYKDGNIISLREKTPTNPFFILYAFRSKALLDQFSDLTGATVTHLPIERAKMLSVKVPDVDGQNSVVANLEGLENETQELARIYEQKLATLEALKKLILQKAFSGELTSPPSQAIKEAAE
jgi:type I restriction enzyme S subunit